MAQRGRALARARGLFYDLAAPLCRGNEARIAGDKWHPPETAAREHERRRAFAKLGVNVYEIFGADRCFKDSEGVVNDFLLAFSRSA
jgi:hypothetical protein